MSVWLAGPSARDGGGTFPLWRERGYKLCVWRDPGASPIEADHVLTGEWRGAYHAINECMRWAFANDESCDWCVFSGDDGLPDPNKSPEEIATELSEHFGGTYGVCQPVGDPWTDSKGRVIERVAGSPWVGREFARRINRGRGVFHEGFWHMFGDEALQEVAVKLGVFWQRHDVCHEHRHWGRPLPGQKMVINPVIPKFLERANSPGEWQSGKAEFDRLKRSGFAEYMELLP